MSTFRIFQRVVGISCMIGSLVFIGWMWSMVGEPSPVNGWQLVVIAAVLGAGSGWGLRSERGR